jgi:hypothetical protein
MTAMRCVKDVRLAHHPQCLTLATIEITGTGLALISPVDQTQWFTMDFVAIAFLDDFTKTKPEFEH